MKSLYASPLRVYLCLGALALAGIIAGLNLPVSLFPNSSKPAVMVNMGYGGAAPTEFLNAYGRTLEEQFRALSTGELEVTKTTANYGKDSVRFEVEFKWGADPKLALREIQNVVNAFQARMSQEVRDSTWIWQRDRNSGFLAVSFYSSKRSIDEVYDIVKPAMIHRLAKVQDANNPRFRNPNEQEIRVELIPEKMAALQILPRDVERAVSAMLSGYSGGSVTEGQKTFSVIMPPAVNALDSMNQIVVPTPTGSVHLSDVARVDLGPKTTDTSSYSTNGAPSLLLIARPRQGGNVKRMAEEIIQIVEETAPNLPKDIGYRVLVDPSEFVRASVNNVLHEVAIGSLLAVCILFLFIGSLKNTITAAIEIPLSMVLAFILMRLSGMNLNLISLGGLALSAGMNVDASVVVMENIFRHFEETKGPHSFEGKLKIICEAVAEVRFAVIASTIASLVVFLPLAFTSDLSYAILGDLAKTVVFSHGFSAFIALILVPTVRLHLMTSAGFEKPARAPIEGLISWLENSYARTLSAFLSRPKLQLASYAGLTVILAALIAFGVPRLPKEVIGRPDSDWIMVGMNTQGNTLIKQFESRFEEEEARLLAKFGDHILYTFTQVWGPNEGAVMARLKDKREMSALWKQIESEFTTTPTANFWVEPWNPAELPIPNPPNLELVITGGEPKNRVQVAEKFQTLLSEKKVFSSVYTDESASRTEDIILRPNLQQWPLGQRITPSDLADISRVATTGRPIGKLYFGNKDPEIILRYPEGQVRSAEDLAALPIGLGPKLIPLKALAQIRVEEVPPTIVRVNGRDEVGIYGKKHQGDETNVFEALEKSKMLIEEQVRSSPLPKGVTYSFEDAERELNGALKQLGWAIALSVLLMFLTLVLQFGSVVNALLVLVAAPLGFIGVISSLLLFRSTLSLNSALGVILLNGIAVANSIILVDFIIRLVEQGASPVEAAVEAGRKRLRPILITSLTTILGMIPVAIGAGEGGKILQPLGVAVSGGLWVSMTLTLFIVPSLQVRYLGRRQRIANRRELTGSAEAPQGLARAVSPPAFQHAAGKLE